MVAAHGLSSPEFLPLPVGAKVCGYYALKRLRRRWLLKRRQPDPRCIFPREARGKSGIIGYLGAGSDCGYQDACVIRGSFRQPPLMVGERPARAGVLCVRHCRNWSRAPTRVATG